jgi:hypothetical protein
MIIAPGSDKWPASLPSRDILLGRTSLRCSKLLMNMGRTSADGDESEDAINAAEDAVEIWEARRREPPGSDIVPCAATGPEPGFNVAEVLTRLTAAGRYKGPDINQEASPN